ncbi:MAG TPA: 50S ribosomal protein L18 [Chloroflexi bacterium]|nr:50S ribosomal protein L18 [Chloroflexota bacterium]
MERSEVKRKARLRRHQRVRKKVRGRDGRPRLSVFRSARHIYAQIIDDTRGHTLASASTLDKELKNKLEGLRKREQARLVGETLARRAKSRGVTRVVFDRGGYRYHGRVRSLAEGVREAGLEF